MRSDLVLRAWYAPRSQISIPYMTSLSCCHIGTLGRTVSGHPVGMQQIAIAVLSQSAGYKYNLILGETENCTRVRYDVAVIGGIYVNIRRAKVRAKRDIT